MKCIIVLAVFVVCALAAPPSATLTNHLTKVISGHDAKEGEFPHQVSLQWLGGHLCGGSIISEKYVITAGHCKISSYEDEYQIKVGLTKLNAPTDTHQTLDISAFIVHPDYAGDVNPNDIAVIRVKGTINLDGKLVKAIQVGTADDYQGIGVLSGWGDTLTSSPNTLQTAEVSILDHADCSKRLTGILGSDYPLDRVSNICSGGLQSNEGACFGDSGGPLIVRDADNGDTLIGVVSWGIAPCGIETAPSVYTRVSSFSDFISDVMSQNL